MKKFKEDQNGAAIAIFFIILIPLMFVALVGIVTFTNAVTNSDVTVQESIATSAKSAAMAMNTTAQADGIIRVNTEKAHNNFKQSLCETLGLKNDLTPDTEVFPSKPEYWLLVYNGYNDYTDYHSAHLYYYNGTNLIESNLATTGFPATFSISETGIVAGAGGDYEVTLETPGVVSVVKIASSNIVNKSSSTIIRWASARIVGQNGNFKVI